MQIRPGYLPDGPAMAHIFKPTVWEWPEGIPLADGQPDTIATALVQSALQVSWADVKMAGHPAG